MRVFYIHGANDGCNYVRCIMPAYHNGWTGSKPTLASQRMNPQAHMIWAKHADVLVFHRPDDPKNLELMRKIRELNPNVKIVLDNDDTFHYDVPDKMGDVIKLRAKNIDEFIEGSDLCTTTTDFLAKEYEKLNKVVVLPNCVDPEDWPTPKKNESNKVRIGFVGSVSSNGDYDPVVHLMHKLNKMDNVQMVLLSLPPKLKDNLTVQELYKPEYNFWEQFNVEWTPWVQMVDYFDAANDLRLDIMLIPRKDNYFNRAKSNLKFLEASMLEIPVVAQSFSDGLSPYDKDIDGENGFLALTQKDWEKHTLRLIEDKELRVNTGKKAKEYVLSKYDINKNKHKWLDAYNSIK